MQPSPIAETSGPRDPSLRVRIAPVSTAGGVADLLFRRRYGSTTPADCQAGESVRSGPTPGPGSRMCATVQPVDRIRELEDLLRQIEQLLVLRLFELDRLPFL